MLMMEHKSDIERILHDLKQIEHSDFDDRLDLPTLKHSRMLAREAAEELVTLLHTIETEEIMQQSMGYDPKVVEDMSMIAYHMSFYGWPNLLDEVDSTEEACIRCADLIGCNPLSLMNMKTIYDDYIYSIENQWSSKRTLPEDMSFVMQICDNMTQQEVLMACHRILGMNH